MQDVLIIPTFDRPEMLWLCLEHIARIPDSRDVMIQVYVDAHLQQPLPPRAEIEEVLAKFPKLTIQVGYRSPHEFHGNSFNVLMAYRLAINTAYRYVFMIEDDVMIRSNFFEWHRKQHEDPEVACSVGVLKEPQHGPYASLGVCFRRETLSVIVPHCNKAYFKNMRQYCRAKFQPSKHDCEQDGLLIRLLAGRQIVWPVVPVAQHVGWYGYHRKRSIRPAGSLEERYGQVKMILSNKESLRLWVRDFGDIAPLYG